MNTTQRLVMALLMAVGVTLALSALLALPGGGVVPRRAAAFAPDEPRREP